jgi:hypothetical protein
MSSEWAQLLAFARLRLAVPSVGSSKLISLEVVLMVATPYLLRKGVVVKPEIVGRFKV